MNKNIFLFGIIFISTNLVFASGGIYTNNYVKHLKNCEVYIEKYDAKIPADETAQEMNLQTTESILGWKNGKCLTKSIVYSKELKKDILSSNCVFNENQLDTVVKKMQNSKSKDSKEQQKVQNDIAKYIKDNSICITQNLINK